MVETPDVLSYLRTPVFIVGTHADKRCEDTKDVTSKILREISIKEYGKHVIPPFFFIDNTQGDNHSHGNSGNSGISLHFKEILKQVNHVFGFNIMC